MSSSLVLAGAKYILQKSFDTYLEKLKEENRLLVEENARRKASTYDAQVTAFNKINSISNRLQVITRDFSQRLGSDNPDYESAAREVIRDYKIHVELFNETILEEGLWFPPALFLAIRNLKGRVDHVNREAEKFRKHESPNEEQYHELVVIAQSESRKADEDYETIREIIQLHLGVTDEA